MRVLLVHPKDDLLTGPWRQTRWDLIVDFGWCGRNYYEEASRQTGARILSFQTLLSPEIERDRMRQLFSAGLGALIDREGVDWWDILIPYWWEVCEQLLLSTALASEVKSADEIATTRAHFPARVLELLLGRRIVTFASAAHPIRSRFDSYSKALSDLRPSQLLEIALDKWDMDYRFRRFAAALPPRSTEGIILLPSAYQNVTYALAAYAGNLPAQRFLQVVTRRSGRIAVSPPNVEVRSLAAFAPIPFPPSTDKEFSGLSSQWRELQEKRLIRREEFSLAIRMGIFDRFVERLKLGLRVRDAWLRVFENEPISAVFSADENNAYTRLPLVIAKAKRIPTTFCDHGALNLTPSIRPACADTYLARGKMARDYWVGWCGMPEERVVVGAPEITQSTAIVSEQEHDAVVFFSEQFELYDGRPAYIYREVLKPLYLLAQKSGRKLVVKLHPFESLKERRRLIRSIFSAEELRSLEIVSGPLTSRLLGRAWCGVTVQSSTALQCCLNGVPCFLCHWLDNSWCQYGLQLARFGAARILKSPNEIESIPHLIETSENLQTVCTRLSTPISPAALAAVLSGSHPSTLTQPEGPVSFQRAHGFASSGD